MIKIDSGISTTLRAQDFYHALESSSGLKLHKDFNCTLTFNDNSEIISIAVTGDNVKEQHVRKAAGIVPLGSASNYFREQESEN